MERAEIGQLLKRITYNPEIFGGRPLIRGMRIRVVDVLEMLAGGMTSQEILDDYTYLEAEDITACLLYASMIVGNKTIFKT
ncbi:MAG: DUF433 domain-containing protein [Chitinophagales bacterium]